MINSVLQIHSPFQGEESNTESNRDTFGGGEGLESDLKWRWLEESSIRYTELWPSVPPHLLIHGINSTSSFPFASTASSNVMKGNLNDTAVAMKAFRLSAAPAVKTIRRFYLEALLWSKLKHPNILPFLGLHAGGSLQISMISKFMKNGVLPSYLASHPDADRLALLTGVANGVAYLHTLPNPVLHGDLRGMNILVGDDGEPYIIDLGYSLIMDTRNSKFYPHDHAFAGSVRWTSGEKLRPGEFPLTLKSDVYSFACLCVEVFSGKLPFDHLVNDGAVVIDVLVKRRKPSRPAGPESHQLSDPLWEVLQCCFARDPAARPSMSYVHLFLTSLNSSSNV